MPAHRYTSQHSVGTSVRVKSFHSAQASTSVTPTERLWSQERSFNIFEDVNARECPVLGITTLHTKANGGDVPVMEALVEDGVEPNASNLVDRSM